MDFCCAVNFRHDRYWALFNTPTARGGRHIHLVPWPESDIDNYGTNLHTFLGIRQAERPPTPDSFSEDMERDYLQELNNLNEHDRGNPLDTLWNPGEFHDRLNEWEQLHDGSIILRGVHHTRCDDNGDSAMEI